MRVIPFFKNRSPKDLLDPEIFSLIDPHRSVIDYDYENLIHFLLSFFIYWSFVVLYTNIIEIIPSLEERRELRYSFVGKLLYGAFLIVITNTLFYTTNYWAYIRIGFFILVFKGF